VSTSESSEELSPAAAAFAAHLSEFHRGLPSEKQALLEQLVSMAEASGPATVKGYSIPGGSLPLLRGQFFQSIYGGWDALANKKY